jgi:hypothetical protein
MITVSLGPLTGDLALEVTRNSLTRGSSTRSRLSERISRAAARTLGTSGQPPALPEKIGALGKENQTNPDDQANLVECSVGPTDGTA